MRLSQTNQAGLASPQAAQDNSSNCCPDSNPGTPSNSIRVSTSLQDPVVDADLESAVQQCSDYLHTLLDTIQADFHATPDQQVVSAVDHARSSIHPRVALGQQYHDPTTDAHTRLRILASLPEYSEHAADIDALYHQFCSKLFQSVLDPQENTSSSGTEPLTPKALPSTSDFGNSPATLAEEACVPRHNSSPPANSSLQSPSPINLPQAVSPSQQPRELLGSWSENAGKSLSLPSGNPLLSPTPSALHSAESSPRCLPTRPQSTSSHTVQGSSSAPCAASDVDRISVLESLVTKAQDDAREARAAAIQSQSDVAKLRDLINLFKRAVLISHNRAKEQFLAQSTELAQLAARVSATELRLAPLPTTPLQADGTHQRATRAAARVSTSQVNQNPTTDLVPSPESSTLHPSKSHNAPIVQQQAPKPRSRPGPRSRPVAAGGGMARTLLTTPESESNVIHARVHVIPDDATALKPSAIISGQPEVQPTNMVGAPHQVPHSSVTLGDNASTRPQGTSDSFFSTNTSATSKEAYGPPSECQQPITVIIRRSQQQSNPKVPPTNSRDSLSLPRLRINNSQTELSSVGSQHTHPSSTNDPQSPFSSAVLHAQLQQSGPRPGSVKPKGRRSRSARSTPTPHTSTPQPSIQNPLTTHVTCSGQSQPLSGPSSSASKLQGPRPRQDSLSPIDRWADEHATCELSPHPKQTFNNPSQQPSRVTMAHEPVPNNNNPKPSSEPTDTISQTNLIHELAGTSPPTPTSSSASAFGDDSSTLLPMAPVAVYEARQQSMASEAPSSSRQSATHPTVAVLKPFTSEDLTSVRAAFDARRGDDSTTTPSQPEPESVCVDDAAVVEMITVRDTHPDEGFIPCDHHAPTTLDPIGSKSDTSQSLGPQPQFLHPNIKDSSNSLKERPNSSGEGSTTLLGSARESVIASSLESNQPQQSGTQNSESLSSNTQWPVTVNPRLMPYCTPEAASRVKNGKYQMTPEERKDFEVRNRASQAKVTSLRQDDFATALRIFSADHQCIVTPKSVLADSCANLGLCISTRIAKKLGLTWTTGSAPLTGVGGVSAAESEANEHVVIRLGGDGREDDADTTPEGGCFTAQIKPNIMSDETVEALGHECILGQWLLWVSLASIDQYQQTMEISPAYASSGCRDFRVSIPCSTTEDRSPALLAFLIGNNNQPSMTKYIPQPAASVTPIATFSNSSAPESQPITHTQKPQRGFAVAAARAVQAASRALLDLLPAARSPHTGNHFISPAKSLPQPNQPPLTNMSKSKVAVPTPLVAHHRTPQQTKGQHRPKSPTTLSESRVSRADAHDWWRPASHSVAPTSSSLALTVKHNSTCNNPNQSTKGEAPPFSKTTPEPRAPGSNSRPGATQPGAPHSTISVNAEIQHVTSHPTGGADTRGKARATLQAPRPPSFH
jgi:hypothetical protein